MPVERSIIINILKRIHLFRGVDDQKLEAITDMIEQVELPASSPIFREDDDPDYFYIVASGRVRISRNAGSQQPALPLGFLEEEDYFGEEVLESGWPRKISADTETDVILLRMSVPTLVAMLDLVPPLAQRLQLILDSYRLMLNTHFDWRDAEEAIYFIARRHVLFMWLNILPPTVLGAIFIPILFFLYLSTALSMTFLGLLLLTIAVLIAWWVWSYIDWTNDYYFVTNRRVVYQERVVLFYDSRQESPLEAVQSTQTNTSQWGRWLGYGNVAIRTYIGTILFQKYRHARTGNGHDPGTPGQGPVRTVPLGTALDKKHDRSTHPHRAAAAYATRSVPAKSQAQCDAAVPFHHVSPAF